MDQIIIKSILVIAFVLFAAALMRSGGSARAQAIRTIALLVFLVAAIVAVLFPAIVNDLAVSVGVGRGADLLLYALLIAFIGNALTSARKRSTQDARITELARTIALQRPLWPEDERSQGAGPAPDAGPAQSGTSRPAHLDGGNA